MFDFDASKLIIVGVIALIFIPTKDLPRVLRQVGQFVGKMRRLASEFQGQFMDAMRDADMADLRQEAQKLSEAARASSGLDTVHDFNRHMTGTLAAAPPPPATGHVQAAVPATSDAMTEAEPPHHDDPQVDPDATDRKAAIGHSV